MQNKIFKLSFLLVILLILSGSFWFINSNNEDNIQSQFKEPKPEPTSHESEYGYIFNYDKKLKLEIKFNDLGDNLFNNSKIVERIEFPNTSTISIERQYCSENKKSIIESASYFKDSVIEEGIKDGFKYKMFSDGCYECYNENIDEKIENSYSFYVCSENGFICLIATSKRGSDFDEIKKTFLSNIIDNIKLKTEFNTYECLEDFKKG